MTTAGQSDAQVASKGSASSWDAAEARQIMETYRGLDGALMPILHALQERFGYVDDAAVPDLADILESQPRRGARRHHLLSRLPPHPAGPPCAASLPRRSLPGGGVRARWKRM